MSLYVRKEHTNQVTWSKEVDFGRASLSEVASGLLELLQCDTCEGTGEMRWFNFTEHTGNDYLVGKAQPEPGPCPEDCVGGIRLPLDGLLPEQRVIFIEILKLLKAMEAE